MTQTREEIYSRADHPPNSPRQEIISSSDSPAEAENDKQLQERRPTDHAGHLGTTSDADSHSIWASTLPSNSAPVQTPRTTQPQTPKQTKLQAKISTLQSNITATEAQLALKLQKITELESSPQQERDAEQQRERDAEQQQTSPSPLASASVSDTNPATHHDHDPARARAAQDHAQRLITTHITLLKGYNEIKDIACGMLSLIAEKQGRTLSEVMAERGLSERD
ncbi:hypothetical protein A1O7_02745 [Cladophialophora yegresii CBS 114405]|uniref:DNA repair protein Swi5/Sae3 n=1 Tax=Cladophialophora yegresii CBS 114405 TaxID=1182544 RepID=W9WCM6_9EURO|nr:uncharacterized protein A1O7_02745 [Cladophialophora yegresii CBS 114405]EXJ62311.1 hypothetical protein A1O7_02745 [Cladophialophora yegresii CBS 114405]